MRALSVRRSVTAKMSCAGLSFSTPLQSAGQLRTRQQRVACPAQTAQKQQREHSAYRQPRSLRLDRQRARELRSQLQRLHAAPGNYTSNEQLDLTEENIEAVLQDARVELMQMFDETVGMTGTPPPMSSLCRCQHPVASCACASVLHPLRQTSEMALDLCFAGKLRLAGESLHLASLPRP